MPIIQPGNDVDNDSRKVSNGECVTNGTVAHRTASSMSEDEEVPQAAYWTRPRLLSLFNFAVSNFTTSVYFAILGPFFPQEATGKGASPVEIGIIFSVYELVIILSSPFFGANLTRIGAKLCYVTGLFLCGSCAILFGFLENCPPGPVFVAMCVVVRCMEALGVSAFQTASLALLAASFPDRATTMIGTLEIAGGLGLMVAPILGGVLYHLGGFRLPFLVSGSVTLVICLTAIFTLPSDQQVSGAPGTRGSMLRLLRLPLVSLMVALVAVGSCCVGFVDVSLALALTAQFSLKPIIIGLVFFVSCFAYTLASPVFGWIADKVSLPCTLLVIIAGFTVNALGFLLLGPAPFLHISSHLYLVITSQAFYGLGLGAIIAAFSVINDCALEAGFEQNLETYGLVSGLFSTFFSLGGFCGPLLSGALVKRVGFAWTSFIMSALAFLVVLLLVLYMLVRYCWGCCQDRSEERTPLLHPTRAVDSSRGDTPARNALYDAY